MSPRVERSKEITEGVVVFVGRFKESSSLEFEGEFIHFLFVTVSKLLFCGMRKKVIKNLHI
jgi:hypothetical protein